MICWTEFTIKCFVWVLLQKEEWQLNYASCILCLKLSILGVMRVNNLNFTKMHMVKHFRLYCKLHAILSKIMFQQSEDDAGKTCVCACGSVWEREMQVRPQLVRGKQSRTDRRFNPSSPNMSACRYENTVDAHISTNTHTHTNYSNTEKWTWGIYAESPWSYP